MENQDDIRLVNEMVQRESAFVAQLDADAEPLARAARPERIALLFGSEGHGLDRSLVDRCDRRLTIAMRRGTDSLNVAVAAGIFLYHFTR